jgi:ElaA protein
LRVAAPDELDAATLYAILRLRCAVFVVEQHCAYLDVDGRDLEPGALHCWQEEDGRVLAYLRVLREGPARRIGRVATAPAVRGRGYAEALVRTAVRLAAPAPVVLDAQAHLVSWYERLGFRVAGAEYDDDGIPHVPLTYGP